MFGMSAWHLTWLIVIGLVVFGPDRLPSLLRDAGKALRQVRKQAMSMQEDLKAELGPEVGDLDLRSLHPRTFIEKHLFSDEEDPLGLDFLHKEVNEAISFDKPTADTPPAAEGISMEKSMEKATEEPDGKTKYDVDAT
jgi:sec-independent protein translocase protein TatB